ncbi:MAG: fumarylacetoacetate hydrolase family protein [Rhodothermales bacterium]
MKALIKSTLFLAFLALTATAAAQDGIIRYVRFEHGSMVSYGLLEGETVRALDGYDLFASPRPTDRTFSLSEVRLLTPIDPLQVQKVLGIAINTRRPGREEPVPHPRFFAKMPTSLRGLDDSIELPPEASNLNYEGELVLIIGKQGRHIPEAEALDYVFGVTVGDDFSENTWYGERQGVDEPTRLLSKGTDSWAPIGPSIVTGIDYTDLAVETRLNGEVVQRGRTSDLVNGVSNLISYISRYLTLMPGDVIFTGTVARIPESRRVMQAGDVVEVEIEHLGVLRNRIVTMESMMQERPASNPQPSAFVVDASWPRPLPNNWILGQVSGVAVDSRDHVWIVHRPRTLTPREAGAVQDPPLSACCVPAPSVIEFDQEGNVVQAWGGPDSGQQWPDSEHGLFIDHEDNIWIGSNGRNDQVVLKFSRDGELLLQIGEWGVTGGSDDTVHLGQPADVAVDAETNEVYIADGYGNRRIVVFDATTGEYKRHWGAYGEAPDDSELPDFDPEGSPIRSFRSPVHSVRLSNDGLVYVADRVNNRIQVFRTDGTFVKEGFVARGTLAMGAVWDLELSQDPAQTYLYVPDGTNQTVWVLRRDDLEVVGSFGRGGRYAGQFGWVHNAAMDTMGNLYTTEVETGKRVQKFKPAVR